MIDFKILKKSKKSKARLGILRTKHGVVETPCLVPVATQAVVKTLNSEEVLKTKTQILIANSFHLHLKPGEKIVEKSKGLHKFMNWPKPLMTDSGGFQVFSLGFGRDFNIGKIMAPPATFRKRASSLAPLPASLRVATRAGDLPLIKEGGHPKSLRINNDGVFFKSPIDGREIFLGPRESIKIQEALGADIIFSFDECTPPNADYDYTKKSLLKTHKWAEICIKTKESEQSIFGIVQGGKYYDLREESARFIASLDFDGFGIGGEFGDDKKIMKNMIARVVNNLPQERPRHLLGIGHLEDIENIIRSGVDFFDCTVPTHYARRGIAFTKTGKLNLSQAKFLNDEKPLDLTCSCSVCWNYKRNYISHLMKAKEITGLALLTFHNIYFFNSFVEGIRKKIKTGKI
ncbi:MAG: hypothetical protein A3F95_03070 [Candidatus Nealsonbacteria bacterium RIFCSPLOWO2_12_FULL_39_31]|uniref:Queuine tRNA-ribosyltransferase n=3 Tax=Candidatus Nealsoniibacteriota TaxID=1817911 RepID=A0A1G2EKB3_9BACT|nr:MAG: hypothetical protein A2626_02195 [Candidatus Nealsonbacteria bacterium RIFCSPHIGHO2_01_FULL_38_55]OGZ21566.1 MAG: hypothetical protein A3C48_01920 [Candidatus Nealsonbacteria bacterium RIFCSPHIGHO2_02_FULL_38_75]OGZ22411.1 MAG: hypothetical protein A3E18_00535 [Candidatus Nealsonbacteria bacterium RIFCSPHIGHO2_12_FULL_38_18]OGZ23325.1 MAG: hypothetical protein A2981_03025 [Candidatus Nealsonbacteria bacterium RIFCSPLOWO2_01_FULL_38_120]OGZ26209.1 MAG: hypothetical protein A2W71_00940 [C